jgi:hypothetical protein
MIGEVLSLRPSIRSIRPPPSIRPRIFAGLGWPEPRRTSQRCSFDLSEGAGRKEQEASGQQRQNTDRDRANEGERLVHDGYRSMPF